MVVDLQKLAGKNIDHLTQACHYAHNVPDFGEDKQHDPLWQIFSRFVKRWDLFSALAVRDVFCFYGAYQK